ncbi:hypothetical protein K0T92_01185 [Paenibacillus oenotherae]|uniref:Apea-like HEPN domain-containing protein n=1 Tax=Paenibacillus oenotherae TaxID=1435645 RepID=A0ABS7D0I9_9BACL|nr:hypothetical protein [Paenibacillus oenotherae]MBW7473353.1 hypothetical protein [Paenibacillus oenotherae]
MKLFNSICHHCAIIYGEQTVTDFEVNEEGVSKVVCRNGHEMTVVLQNFKFEILFELGLKALEEGYYREAVSSFAASVERFYECCIKIFINKSGLTDRKNYDNTWKLISNNSQRQMGAFYFLFLNEFNETPTQVKNNVENFRNKVIHQGIIPEYVEVYEYSKYLYGYLIEIIKKVKIRCESSIINILMEEVSDKSAKLEYPTWTAGFNTAINITQSIEMIGIKNFDEVLASSSIARNISKSN